MFTKLKEITEHALKIKVNDCVISVSLLFHLLKGELDKFTLPDITIITLCKQDHAIIAVLLTRTLQRLVKLRGYLLAGSVLFH